MENNILHQGNGNSKDQASCEATKWDILARKELEHNGPYEKKMENCLSVYKAGIKEIPTLEMWTLYLKCIIELNMDLTSLADVKQNYLKNAFKDAHDASMLTENYYLEWVNRVKDANIKLILQWATEKYGESHRMWLLRISFLLSNNDETEAVRLFRKVIQEENIPEQTKFWFQMLRYFQITDKSQCKKLWREAANNHRVGAIMKSKYIEWLAVFKGIVHAQEEYKTIAINEPLSLGLHISMLKLLDAQPDINMKFTRAVFETAIRQFGNVNAV